MAAPCPPEALNRLVSPAEAAGRTPWPCLRGSQTFWSRVRSRSPPRARLG